MCFKEQSLGYAVADLTGTIVEISAAYASVMGRHASEFVGRDFRSFMPADFCADGIDCFNELVASGRSAVAKAECILPDGSILAMSVCMMLVWNSERQVTAVLIVPQASTVESQQKIPDRRPNGSRSGLERFHRGPTLGAG